MGKTAEQVRMRVTITFDYLTHRDPEVYEGTTDPYEMGRIDATNPPEELLALADQDPIVSIRPVTAPGYVA